MRVILRNVSRSSAAAQTMVLWIICNAMRRAATAVFRQALSTRKDSIMPSRLFGVTVRLPAKAACAALLGVEIVVFAAFATVVLVRCRDLENFDAGLLHVAQKPRAI